MKIAAKLIAGFGTVSLLLAALIGISYTSLMNLKELQDAGAKRADDALVLSDIGTYPVKGYQIVADAIINRNLDESWQEWLGMKKTFLETGAILDSLVDTDAEKKLATEVNQRLNEFIRIFETVLWPVLQTSSGISPEIQKIDGDFDRLVLEFSKPIDEITRSFKEEQKEADIQFDGTSAQMVTSNLVLGAIALLFALVLSIVISGSISRPIGLAVATAQEIAGGELRNDVPEAFCRRKDEIGDLAKALQNMVSRLRQVIGEVNTASLQVSAGSQQLSSTSQQMSQGATEQAASVEEISSSMEEMTSNIKQNADNAVQTENIARKSALSAEEGGRSVSATVSAMKEIASKIGIIEEIARSTNMLALNASIEAARAGEYGKGFAVVASEVGKLAERSQKEAGEIIKLSKESVVIAEHAGTTINAIIPDIKRTAELVQEISAASNEQNSGAEQINSAIMQLDKVVQQNASASEESASMSEELASQAEQMQGTMEFFKIDSGVSRQEFVAEQPVLIKSEPARIPAAKPATRAKPQPAAKPAPVDKSAPEEKSVQAEKASPAAATKKPAKKTAVKAAVKPADKPAEKSTAKPAAKKTAEKNTEKTEAAKRLPVSGIHLVLDDDAPVSSRDSLDNDFQEF